MMKTNRLLIILAGLILVWSCKDGFIDEITKVSPGADVTAPVVTVAYPQEGTEIKVAAVLTSVNIRFEVSDDIEIKSIVVKVDGADIATFTEFLDYRRAVKEVLHNGLATGDHVLSIVATDIENKVTTQNINFAKVPPYIPIFDGEIFYMPFDGIYTDLISITSATPVGSPAFAGEGKKGGNAYKGATDAYLTYPTTGLIGTEFSASFWMKVNGTPDRAGVLVAGPPGINTRTQGFRLFRENAGGKQRFKLNIGTGAEEQWFDGGAAADVVPNTGEWVHIAISISATNAAVYVNGASVSQGPLTNGGIDWTGCDFLSIMSGGPRFSEWGHNSDLSYMDELRFFDKALTQGDVLAIIDSDYSPKYDGEIFYMPFDSDFADLVGGANATEVGAPALAGTGKVGGNSLAGATGSYLTYPTTNLANNEFSATFWMKVDASPDRAGILVMGPPGDNIRTHGFRFFREAAGAMQRFKLNVGNGTEDSWFDGGAAADVNPTGNPWVHIAFTISDTKSVVYINGVVAATGAFTGVDFTGCDVLSIMSGAPRFMEWGHLSDESYMDELRIFDKELSQTEIQEIMND